MGTDQTAIDQGTTIHEYLERLYQEGLSDSQGRRILFIDEFSLHAQRALDAMIFQLTPEVFDVESYDLNGSFTPIVFGEVKPLATA